MWSKLSLLLFVVFYISFSTGKSSGFSKVIYGEDGRLDTYQLENDFDKALGRSTAILIQGYNVLTENNDGSFTVTSTQTAKQFWNFCSKERFSDQDIMSHGNTFCSGFLISDNWLLTAAHCTSDIFDRYYVIFGFELISSSKTVLTFSADDVYGVTDIISVGTPSGDKNDFGILQLDRPVVGYQPYSKINRNLQVGDALTLIGYPVGLPKKTDKGGEVTFVGNQIIRGTVDSYGGNSGSPIFDVNGLLVGILVGGSQDFVSESGCEVSNYCPGNSGCEALGEYIVPICVPLTSNDIVEEKIGKACSQSPPEFDIFTYSIVIENSATSLQSCAFYFTFFFLFVIYLI